MKSFTNRRALSSVVTTAMMLTAVAVIGTGVVVWSNSNLKAFETTLVTSASDKTNKINEAPIIENIVFVPYLLGDPATKYVNMTVTNVGTVGFNVTAIKITDGTTTKSYSITNGGIAPHLSTLFYKPFPWASGIPITITTTTKRGTVTSTQASP
jgi:hypothetical protein